MKKQSDRRSWHNGTGIEITLYSNSLRNAARTLIQNLDLQPSPNRAWDACPVILLYRQAVELQLKELIGEGGNFLQAPIDPITLSKTHSLRWLAQIVCQIIKTVRRETDFQCEAFPGFATFTALIAELEELDPVTYSERICSRAGTVPPRLEARNVVVFAKQLDTLLAVLATTTDDLAATWDLLRCGPETLLEDDTPNTGRIH